MWTKIPEGLRVVEPWINKAGQLVYGISPQDAGKSFEDLLAIAATYDDYRDFLTEECCRFETFQGTPVLTPFSTINHCENYLGVVSDAPLVLCFDPAGTHPAYGIYQYIAGRLIVHGHFAPRRKPGYEIDLESICKRLIADFRDPDSKFYNRHGWQFTVISDHMACYENNQGVPGKAKEILERYFNTDVISYHMTKQVYLQSFNVCVGAFASSGLVTVNPKCELTNFTYKAGWHYPLNMDELEHPKPEPLHPYIDVGDCTRYTTYHFYRPEDAPSEAISELDKYDSGLLDSAPDNYISRGFL